MFVAPPRTLAGLHIHAHRHTHNAATPHSMRYSAQPTHSMLQHMCTHPTNQTLPTHQPANQPTSQPTNQPTNQPASQTQQPTNQPTNNQPSNPKKQQPTKQQAKSHCTLRCGDALTGRCVTPSLPPAVCACGVCRTAAPSGDVLCGAVGCRWCALSPLLPGYGTPLFKVHCQKKATPAKRKQIPSLTLDPTSKLAPAPTPQHGGGG